MEKQENKPEEVVPVLTLAQKIAKLAVLKCSVFDSMTEEADLTRTLNALQKTKMENINTINKLNAEVKAESEVVDINGA